MRGHYAREFWVLKYINGAQFIGRFGTHWTRGYDLECAVLFATEIEAENARQALLQEAYDRVNTGDRHSDFWFDIHGGVVLVQRVEQVTRIAYKVADETPTS